MATGHSVLVMSLVFSQDNLGSITCDLGGCQWQREYEVLINRKLKVVTKKKELSVFSFLPSVYLGYYCPKRPNSGCYVPCHPLPRYCSWCGLGSRARIGLVSRTRVVVGSLSCPTHSSHPAHSSLCPGF